MNACVCQFVLMKLNSACLNIYIQNQGISRTPYFRCIHQEGDENIPLCILQLDAYVGWSVLMKMWSCPDMYIQNQGISRTPILDAHTKEVRRIFLCTTVGCICLSVCTIVFVLVVECTHIYRPQGTFTNTTDKKYLHLLFKNIKHLYLRFANHTKLRLVTFTPRE